MRYFDSTNTTTDMEELDPQDSDEYSLSTEVFEQREYTFAENRERAGRQKLLDELVRENIKANRPSKSKLQAMFDKFLYKK